jgi:hypothetical protein
VGKSHNRSQGQRDAVLIPDLSTSGFAEIALKVGTGNTNKNGKIKILFQKKKVDNTGLVARIWW